MNRAELHNVPGFHPPSLMAAELHLRSVFKPKQPAMEPTALIRSEGWMQGYLAALEDLRAAAAPKPEQTDKREFRPYSQPENQNRP